jgi:hypothetical protein
MFSPPASMGLMLGTCFRSQTRCLKRKSLSRSAPTGQMSATLPESLLSSGLPGKMSISSR